MPFSNPKSLPGRRATPVLSKISSHISADDENLELINSQVLLENLDKEEVKNMLEHIRRLNGKIVQLSRIVNTKNTTIFEWWIKEHSCVSFVQRLLGLKKWFIFTPYQLYCALNKL